MSDRRHNEKEEEKREKEDEKRNEKQMDEKFRRNPARGITLAVILIWGGVVALLQVADLINVHWWNGWSIFLAGTGVIVLIKAAFRLLPEHRRPMGGTLIIGIILLGVGLGDLVGWQYAWPAILILFGVVLVGAVFFRRRR